MKKNNPSKEKIVLKFKDGFSPREFVGENAEEIIAEYLSFKTKALKSKGAKIFSRVGESLLKGEDVLINAEELDEVYVDPRFVGIVRRIGRFLGYSYKEDEESVVVKSFPKTTGNGGSTKGLTNSLIRRVVKV